MKKTDRRTFLKTGLVAGAGLTLAPVLRPTIAWGKETEAATVPAILGGSKAHTGDWPSWPEWKASEYEGKLLEVMRSGVWSRAGNTDAFEQMWASMVGSKRCLTLVNGTSALITALSQAGIGIGDEVITTPYTFVATVQAILVNGAIPVFADVDPQTFQIDPDKIEKKITKRTKAILPVHILGMPADMDRIMEIARKHDLVVIEDACQAHLAEYGGKRVGSIGFAGCFSFQNSKNMPIGEGGAIVSDNDEFMDRCYSYHDFGHPYGSQAGSLAGALMVGCKLRFSEYQAAIGLMEIQQLEANTDLRWDNGQYLDRKVSSIPGISAARLYPKTTKAVYHLFPLIYDSGEFCGMPRDIFLKSLQAEGVPCWSGYSPLHTQPFIKAAFESKLYKKVYSKSQLNYEAYIAKNACPESDALCNEKAVWFQQNLLLTDHAAMDDIARAIEKIHANAGSIMDKYKKGEIR